MPISVSLQLLEKVFDWAISQGGFSTSPLLSRENLERERGVLEQRRSLDRSFFDLLSPLSAAVQSHPPHPDISRFTLGDALVAFQELARHDPHFAMRRIVRRWSPATLDAAPPLAYDTSIDPDLYREMDYGGISERVSQVFHSYPSAWEEHVTSQRNFTLSAAGRLERRRSAALIGVGYGNDSSLSVLAEKFDHLIIIDIDDRSAEGAREGVTDARLKDRIEVRREEISGVLFLYVREVKKILALKLPPSEAVRKICELTESFQPAGELFLLHPGEKVDLMVSHMTLSQLLAIPFQFVERIFRQVYPHENLLRSEKWAYARAVMSYQIWQDHFAVLARHAPLVAVTSERTNQNVINLHGLIRNVGQEVTLSPPLSLLLPSSHHVVEERKWTWKRDYPMHHGHGGQFHHVGGIIFESGAVVPEAAVVGEEMIVGL